MRDQWRDTKAVFQCGSEWSLRMTGISSLMHDYWKHTDNIMWSVGRWVRKDTRCVRKVRIILPVSILIPFITNTHGLSRALLNIPHLISEGIQWIPVFPLERRVNQHLLHWTVSSSFTITVNMRKKNSFLSTSVSRYVHKAILHLNSSFCIFPTGLFFT